MGKESGSHCRDRGSEELNMSEIPQCVMVGHLDIKALDICKRVYDPAGIAPTLTTSGGGVQRSENI